MEIESKQEDPYQFNIDENCFEPPAITKK